MPDEDGTLNVEVTFGGTWMKRGHTSHIGAADVMEVHTGFVLDYEVLFNFYHFYARNKNISTEEQERRVKCCHNNFNGKSGAMEIEFGLSMWQRSKERCF